MEARNLHLMIAMVFIGVLRDPVRNKWVIEFGMLIPLGICYCKIGELERLIARK